MFKNVSGKFSWCFKGVSMKFIKCFKRFPRVIQESFSFKEDGRLFHVNFKWVLRVFERSSKRISGKFQICLKGGFNGFKRVFSLLQESFNAVSRKFEGCFNGDLSGCFKCI